MLAQNDAGSFVSYFPKFLGGNLTVVLKRCPTFLKRHSSLQVSFEVILRHTHLLPSSFIAAN
jgi:hypothetical protein